MFVELKTLEDVFGIIISLSRGLISSKTSAPFEFFAQNIPDIFLNLQKAVYIQDRRWNIELKNNLLIKLPEDKKIRDNALERLQKLIHEKSLLDKKWMVIDLRFPGKIILKSRPSQERD